MTSIVYDIIEDLKTRLNALGVFNYVGDYPDKRHTSRDKKICLVKEGDTLSSLPIPGNLARIQKSFEIIFLYRSAKNRISETIDLCAYIQNVMYATYNGLNSIDNIINLNNNVGGIVYDPQDYLTPGTNGSDYTCKVLTVVYEYTDGVCLTP